MAPDQAEREAHTRFGNIAEVKTAMRKARQSKITRFLWTRPGTVAATVAVGAIAATALFFGGPWETPVPVYEVNDPIDSPPTLPPPDAIGGNVSLPPTPPPVDGAGGDVSAPPRSAAVYEAGGDVSAPRVLKETKPEYTTEAMNAKIQGAVVMTCIVQTDGTCSDIGVVESLDPASGGLDRQARNALAQWRFEPGSRRGQPVPVSVTVEMTFALR